MLIHLNTSRTGRLILMHFLEQRTTVQSLDHITIAHSVAEHKLLAHTVKLNRHEAARRW